MSQTRNTLIEALARELGVEPLDAGEVDAVLDLAGAAAHGTGDRTAAPLACFLAGLAAGGSDRRQALEQVRAHVVAVAPPTTEAAS